MMIAKFVCGVALCLPLCAEWRAVGPFGGAAAVVQVDPFHPDTVIAATSNGMLFRSVNAAASWQPLYFPAQLHCVLHSFLIDPRRPNTYYVGVSGDSAFNSGLFRTNDAGATWTLLPGLAHKEVWSLAAWPEDSKVIAAGTHGGVYLTRDGGEKWDLISDPENQEMQVLVSLAFDPADSKILYAGTPHLPWKTTNGGVTWFPVHNGMLDDSDVFSINTDRMHPGRVYASACSGIYSSQNGGALWAKLTGAQGASYRTYFVSMDPRAPEVVFAGTNHGLVKSADGGRTWRQLSTHLTRFVAFDPHHSGRIYVATDDDGIERSDDEGETLRAMNEGFCNRHLPVLTVAGQSIYTTTIYDSEGGGLYRFAPEDGGWRQVASPSRLLGQQLLTLVPDRANPAVLYGAGYSSVLRSTDAGKSWSTVPANFPRSRITAILGVESGSPYLLAATDNGLFRSTDGGKVWKRVFLPPPSQQAAIGSVLSFAQLKDNLVAALTNTQILLSADGLQWRLTGPLVSNAQPYSVIASGDSLWAATSAGLLRSDDGGQSWKLILNGLPRSTVMAICKHPSQPGVLFAALYSDVYESRDNGASWSRISPDHMQGSIKELAILPEQADRLFALTQRQGIFELPLEAAASGAFNTHGASTGAERGINDK